MYCNVGFVVQQGFVKFTCEHIVGSFAIEQRYFFNAAVTDYNLAIRIFPNNLFAGMFGHTESPLYEAAPEERSNPDVGGLFNK